MKPARVGADTEDAGLSDRAGEPEGEWVMYPETFRLLFFTWW